MENAQQRIVLADSTKLGRATFASVGPLSMVDVLITDAGAPSDFVQTLVGAEVQVVIAD
jgi:DeoR family transcriptional regulator of aga operon